MSYQQSDIILCFPGIGRTFFANSKDTIAYRDVETGRLVDEVVTNENSAFTLDIDWLESMNTTEFAKHLVSIKDGRNYRYVLAPLDSLLSRELFPTRHIVVTPFYDEQNAWIKRWMLAGADAATIKSRLEKWELTSEAFPLAVRLKSDEWLGNILQKTPMAEADGKDV